MTGSLATATMLDLAELKRLPNESDRSNVKFIINQIDFNHVIHKMAEKSMWSLKSAKAASEQYKRFLFLQYQYGKHYSLAPSQEMDEFWHQHILFTQQYQNDCQRIFGHYFHHSPTLKSASSTVHATMHKNFETTQVLYYREFGEYINEIRWLMRLHCFSLSKIVLYIKRLKTKLNIKTIVRVKQ